MEKTKGFTIVELLIVIVVIAILAAISIIAYNGIQQRARDTQRTSDLNSIAKAVRLWSIETSQDFSAMPMGVGGTVPAQGWWHIVYSPGATSSFKGALVDGGYIPNSIDDPLRTTSSPYRAYMVVPCTTGDNKVRVLLTNMETTQNQSLAQQLGRTCTDSSYSAYVSNYNMDYGKLIEL